MATPRILRRPAILAISSSALAATTLLYPTQTLHAESPPSTAASTPPPPQQSLRKPIYPTHPPNPTTPTLQPPPPPSPPSTHPTPTARLAAQIRRARLFTHAHAASAESHLNTLFTSLLAHERSFTSTLQSLRPPPSAGETFLPGSLYVLVATMAGSILTRNRNILLRTSVPAACGVGVAWVVLPATMGNVSELVWEWERRVRVVAEGHMRVRGAVEEGLRMGGERGRGMWEWGREGVEGLRGGVEGWVRKGN